MLAVTMARPVALLSLIALLLMATLASAQNCMAVAYLGQIGGTSGTEEEFGNASQNGPSFGPCDEVPNASCMLTKASKGNCQITLYFDPSLNMPITDGHTITCGNPPTNVSFGSFQIEC